MHRTDRAYRPSVSFQYACTRVKLAIRNGRSFPPRGEKVVGGNEFYISSERPTKSTLVATFRFLGNSVCVLFLLERIVNLFARGEIVEAASGIWQIVSIVK